MTAPAAPLKNASVSTVLGGGAGRAKTTHGTCVRVRARVRVRVRLRLRLRQLGNAPGPGRCPPPWPRG